MIDRYSSLFIALLHSENGGRGGSCSTYSAYSHAMKSQLHSGMGEEKFFNICHFFVTYFQANPNIISMPRPRAYRCLSALWQSSPM
jgi:hypothetical protein